MTFKCPSYGGRKGSALLVVLGMLAFMIVSAVAFAAYMRYSRLPSSYLRRSSASRMLAKAALAKAMDEIDLAISSNPHPGVGANRLNYATTVNSQTLEDQDDPNKLYMNIWKHRIYIGTTNSVYNYSSTNTVPVLTLEGLAYIPAPLVNEARYFGRKSPAAVWKSFDFDAGRYAFCAIDVSDYLDVNRLAAGVPRFAAQNARISLAYAFGNNGQTTQWDNWLEDSEVRTSDGTFAFDYKDHVPFVSCADFNLALGQSGKYGIESPFCKYVTDSGASEFYGAVSDVRKVPDWAFITDSFLPANSTTNTASDVDEARMQPFLATDLKRFGRGSKKTLFDLENYSADGNTDVDLWEFMPLVAQVALFDYLDEDSVPTSLTVPTVEHAPMCFGLKATAKNTTFKMFKREATHLDVGANREITDLTQPTDPNQKVTRTVRTTYIYRLGDNFVSDIIDGLELDAYFVYPFLRSYGLKRKFSVDGKAAIYFAPGTGLGLGLRTKDAGAVLRPLDKDLKENTADVFQNKGVLGFKLKSSTVADFKEVIDSPEDAIKEIPFELFESASDIGAAINGAPLVKFSFDWEQEWDPETGSYKQIAPPAANGIAQNQIIDPEVRLLNSNGALAGNNLPISDGTEYSMNLSVWVRVKGADGSDDSDFTVDLVPAHCDDDNLLNGINNQGFSNVMGDTKDHTLRPLLTFNLGVPFKCSVAEMDALVDQDVNIGIANSLMCRDPRFNHAPEEWEKMGASADLKNEFIDKTGEDFFVATSDQMHLQSVYELAQIPRLSNRGLDGAGNSGYIGDLNKYEGGSDFGNARNEAFFYKTYEPYGSGHDNFEELNIIKPDTGFKINPYSDSTNIIMAALANTPVDWSLSWTNNRETVSLIHNADEFNEQFAWNELGGDYKIKNANLQKIGGEIIKAMHGGNYNASSEADLAVDPVEHGGVTDWSATFANLDWENIFDDAEQGGSQLYETDRKFLYGFWRDCFAAQQQLFLIFVRAEPMMMGGEAPGRIPPQLGARAVALVWRNPVAVSNNKGGYPHNMRILFYKQLD